jgi:putative transposase
MVWSVKYRKAVLKDEVEVELKKVFKQIAAEKDFVIHTMEIMPDHVHLFVSAHPQIAPSYMVKMLKGIGARQLFVKLPELKKQLWDGHLWNSSFYIETEGSTSEEAITLYIEKQKKK